MNKQLFDALLSDFLHEEIHAGPLEGIERRVMERVNTVHKRKPFVWNAWFTCTVTATIILCVLGSKLLPEKRALQSATSTQNETVIPYPRERRSMQLYPASIESIGARPSIRLNVQRVGKLQRKLRIAPIEVTPLTLDALSVEPLLVQ